MSTTATRAVGCWRWIRVKTSAAARTRRLSSAGDPRPGGCRGSSASSAVAVVVRHLTDDVESHRLPRADEDGEEALVEVVRRDLVALVPQEVVERGDELRLRSTGVLLVRARRVSHAAFALRLDELDGEGVVSGPASGGRGGEESARRVRPVEGRLSSVHRADGGAGGVLTWTCCIRGGCPRRRTFGAAWTECPAGRTRRAPAGGPCPRCRGWAASCAAAWRGELWCCPEVRSRFSNLTTPPRQPAASWLRLRFDDLR